MIDLIKVKRTDTSQKKFSILIPTWNNLNYLKLCIKSLRLNSSFEHQFIVVVNEGVDGTLDWVKEQNDVDYVYSPNNLGICYALNICRSLISSEYVMYANDDMYFLPDWDKVLNDEIVSIGHSLFMISATMIEPDKIHPCAVVKNFGNDLSSFQEAQLLQGYTQLFGEDWSGSTWPPNVVHIDCWDMVGGMSIEFSPGMYSDPDFSRKLWEMGVRTFIGKGNSLVYHFSQKTTTRMKKNQGRKTFILKWGISARTFMYGFLRSGDKVHFCLSDKKFTKMEQFLHFFKKLHANV